MPQGPAEAGVAVTDDPDRRLGRILTVLCDGYLAQDGRGYNSTATDPTNTLIAALALGVRLPIDRPITGRGPTFIKEALAIGAEIGSTCAYLDDPGRVAFVRLLGARWAELAVQDPASMRRRGALEGLMEIAVSALLDAVAPVGKLPSADLLRPGALAGLDDRHPLIQQHRRLFVEGHHRRVRLVAAQSVAFPERDGPHLSGVQAFELLVAVVEGMSTAVGRVGVHHILAKDGMVLAAYLAVAAAYVLDHPECPSVFGSRLLDLVDLVPWMGNDPTTPQSPAALIADRVHRFGALLRPAWDKKVLERVVQAGGGAPAAPRRSM